MLTLPEIVRHTLKEDLNDIGDITSQALEIQGKPVKAQIIAKVSGIVAGTIIAKEVFQQVDEHLKISIIKNDGDRVKPLDVIMDIEGNSNSILIAERTALNFLQRLSGIATMTNFFASKLKHAKVYDTRKTTPLLRILEKAAVKSGGGENHRMGLFDEILIKENHIRTVEGIVPALQRAKKNYPHNPREIEVENQNELREALGEKAEIIMLDNMSPSEVRQCLESVKIAPYEPEIEVSGGITLDNITQYDFPGVDRISVGGLTHSVKSLDMSLLVK